VVSTAAPTMTCASSCSLASLFSSGGRSEFRISWKMVGCEASLCDWLVPSITALNCNLRSCFPSVETLSFRIRERNCPRTYLHPIKNRCHVLWSNKPSIFHRKVRNLIHQPRQTMKSHHNMHGLQQPTHCHQKWTRKCFRL